MILIPFITGLAFSPIFDRAIPNKTEKNIICSKSPFERALIILSGIMCKIKSTALVALPCVTYEVTNLASSVDGSIFKPTPGFNIFITNSPIISVRVVIISK